MPLGSGDGDAGVREEKGHGTADGSGADDDDAVVGGRGGRGMGMLVRRGLLSGRAADGNGEAGDGVGRRSGSSPATVTTRRPSWWTAVIRGRVRDRRPPGVADGLDGGVGDERGLNTCPPPSSGWRRRSGSASGGPLARRWRLPPGEELGLVEGVRVRGDDVGDGDLAGVPVRPADRGGGDDRGVGAAPPRSPSGRCCGRPG